MKATPWFQRISFKGLVHLIDHNDWMWWAVSSYMSTWGSMRLPSNGPPLGMCKRYMLIGGTFFAVHVEPWHVSFCINWYGSLQEKHGWKKWWYIHVQYMVGNHQIVQTGGHCSDTIYHSHGHAIWPWKIGSFFLVFFHFGRTIMIRPCNRLYWNQSQPF